MSCEKPFLQSFCWQIDIVLLVDGICTLANVVNVKPIRIDLVSWVTPRGVVMITTVQVKQGFYCNHYLMDMFFLLPQKVLGVFISNSTTFFIDMLTWHGQQRPLKALFYWCYIPLQIKSMSDFVENVGKCNHNQISQKNVK